MYHSKLLKRDVAHPTEAAFLKVALTDHLRSAIAGLLRRGTVRRTTRSPDSSRVGYDRKRQNLDIVDIEEFILGSDEPDFVLCDGKVVFGDPREATRVRMDYLTELVSRYAQGGAVIELGAGNGRNLVHLGRQGVPGRLIGLELSPVSVDVARAHADRFGQTIDFEARDVTVPDALQEFGSPDVVFSVHAMEMMPRVFRGAVANIRSLQPRAAIFFEPVEELWPLSVRGLVSRLRVRQLDRLCGLMAEVSGLGRIVEARALGNASNPLNETAVVVVEMRS